MATYKVIQDIEAEDKLLGPLTLRQFIYAAIALVSAFVAFKLAAVNLLLALPLLPIILFFGALAAPFGRDQPTEVWLLAKIRFFLKPRRRIWDQSGIKEMVTITAPKVVERVLSKNFSEKEVESRLEALANTIDSRGWAVKNINVNLFNQPNYGLEDSDRLVGTEVLPQDMPVLDIKPTDDVLDVNTNPTAQNFEQLVANSTQAHKQQAVDNMKSASQPSDQPADYWFLRGQEPTTSEKGYATFQGSKVVTPGAENEQSTPPSDYEKQLLNKIHLDMSKPNPAYGHMRNIKPMSEQKASKKTKAMPPAPDPAILGFANNNDLSVGTIQHETSKPRKKEPPEGEVEVRLR
ncbi:MAG TPA: PrgI family protein [Patescibacteria group bacterium]|nr:PrgI family protein [Patescibacteria group bacterium]